MAQAQTVQPFNPRYQANAPGDILLIGNTLSTCQSCDPNSSSSDNGNIQSVFVDVDSDPSTTNSSEATLSLPTGSTVLFAALYWGSRTNSALPGSSTTVKFQPPGAAAYTTLTSDALYKTTLSVFPVSTPVYAALKNVTAQVQAAGSGTYRVGGIAMDAANDGLGGYGGWSLVVAYRNNAEPFRNLSVFDGFTVINGSNPQSVTISGFLTPASGTVNARIGSVAYEGDAPLTGDSLIFTSGAATTLSDTENPSTNFFNSSISSLGSRVTSKNPNYLNQLGIDIDRINAPAGTIPNSATGATVTFTTSGDVYFPQVLTTAIDIFVPDLTADFVKTASDLNGGQLLPGDVLEYTVSFSNTGQDGAINTVVRDPLPAGTTYVPGSLRVLTGANAGGKTDASGDDQAEFDSANNRVVFRLGSGANATSGGAFAPGTGSSFRFRVTVNNNTYGQVISNTATINYNAQTLGTAFSDTAGAAVNTAVASIADLSLTKSGSPNVILGSPVSYLLTVSNAGPSNVSGATLTDNVPGSLTGVTWTCAPASACSPASGAGNALSTSVSLNSGSSVAINVIGTASTVGPITNTATVTPPAGVTDPNPSNNTGLQNTTILAAPSLTADKAVSPSGPALPGATLTYTITISNSGGTATGATFTDPLPAGVSYVANSATLNGTNLAAASYPFAAATPINTPGEPSGTLNPGETATLTFQVRVNTSNPPSSIANQGTLNYTGSPAGGVPTNDPSTPAAGDPTVTPVILQKIDVVKSVGTPVQVGVSTFDVPYTLTVGNLGSQTDTNVQVNDYLRGTFAVGNPTLTVQSGPTVSSGGCTANPGFNGTSDTRLLSGSDSLAANARCTIGFTVRVAYSSPASVPSASQNNLAYASTASGPNNGYTFSGGVPTPPASAIATDISTNGSTLPGTANGDSPGPTPVSFSVASIGTAKAVGTPILQANGSYNLTYTVVVRNYGNVALNNAQAADDLTATFPAPTTFAVTAVTGTGANPAFNGSSDKNLLASGVTLAVGESRTLTFSVNVVPNGQFGPFDNSVTATGTPSVPPGNPTPSPVSDTSVNGTNPDPDSDGNPGNNTGPTPVSLTPNPVIGAAKAASPPVLQANGSYTLTYSVVVQNYGNVALSSAQATDDLGATFADAQSFTVSSLSGPGANPAFNGSSDKNLLAAGVTLQPGEVRTLTVQVNVTPKPAGPFGPFNNTVLASGTPPATPTNPNPAPVTDTSHNGTNPDPNGNGDPTEPGENTPTPVTFSPKPLIGVAKAATAPLLQPDGSYTVTYTVRVRNYGNTTLFNVQAGDDLGNTFPAPTTFTVKSVTGLGANPGFNGSSDKNLLAPGVTLQPGEERTVTLTVNVVPNGQFGPFSNVVTGTGTPPSGSPVSDVSDNGQSGVDPDPDGDGDPTNNNDPTVVNLSPNGVIGVAKAAGPAVRQANGSYTLTYTVVVQNYGNVALSSVQASDNLAQTFPAPTTFSVSNVSGSGANPAFNGTSDSHLLAAGVRLEPGESRTLTFTVNVVPNGQFGPFNNSAVASGVPSGSTTPVSDTSDNGTNPDPNGNGDPTEPGENDSTPVSLTPNPLIGVAKAAGPAVLQSGTTYQVTYTVLLKNYGNVDLQDVQVSDNLAQTFPTPTTFSVTDVSGNGANPSFNGSSDKNLLAPGATLAVGESRTLTFTVRVTANPVGPFGPFNNTALASGTSAGGSPVSDVSQNGTDPDPNGNGNPSDPGENTPTPVSLTPKPVIGVAKALTAAQGQADGSYLLSYSLVVANLGNVPLSSAQVVEDLTRTFPAPTTFAVTAVTGTGANPAFNGNSDKNLLASGVTLAVGESRTLSFSVRVRPAQGARIFLNSAIASGTPPATLGDPNPAPVTDTSDNGTNPDPNGNGDPTEPGENDPTPAVLDTADLAISKTNHTPVVQPGSKVTYTIVVTNHGPAAASGAAVGDTLPAGLQNATWTCTATAGSSCAQASGSGNLNTTVNLLAGGSATFILTATVAADAPARIANTATVTAPAGLPDPNPANNTATDQDEVVRLSIIKRALQGTVSIGSTLDWQIQVTNGSAVALSNLTITDTLPLGLVYKAGSSTLEGAALADPTITTVDGRQRLVWTLGSFAPNTSRTVQFSSIVTPATPQGRIVNTVTVSAQAGPPGNPVTVEAGTASAAAVVTLGVFTDQVVIVGRVYFDLNDNNSFEEGTDEPLPGARVYLSNGRFAVTDANGRYSLPAVEQGLYALRLDPLTVPYLPKPVPDDQGQPGSRYGRTPPGGGIVNEDFPLFPARGAAAKVRSTTVRRGDVRLDKALTQGGSGYAVTLTLTLGSPVRNLILTDPLPAGAQRSQISLVGPDGGATDVTPQGDRILVPGTLPPGTYTLRYALTTNLPPDRAVTDPDLTWEVVR